MPEPMFTIGYQGASLEHLVQTLSIADVSVLVDTREMPTSRRPEFRMAALRIALEAVGIRYVSLRALGAPKALRALAQVDWQQFADGYLGRQALVRKEVEGILDVIDAERVCRFCFEADPAACHRSLLTYEIQRLLDVEAVHLDPRWIDEPDDDQGVLPLGDVANDQVKVTSG